MMDDWSLKDKRRLFRSLRDWDCDANCDLYEFSEEERKLIIPEYEYKFTPEHLRTLSDYDLDAIKEGYYYIRGKDIDILRKKLIEDFKSIAQGEDRNNVVWVQTLLCDIIDMINKRFGYDKE